MKAKYSLALLLAIPFFHFSEGQISGMWINSFYDNPFTTFNMSLKGPVKKWTMTNWKGETRTRSFDQNGNQLSDDFTGTQQSFIPLDFKFYQQKFELEKQYDTPFRDSSYTYNQRGQKLSKTQEYFQEYNRYDENGNILIHKKWTSHIETRAWNSTHHKNPTYSYVQENGSILLYKYRRDGQLKEIAHYHTDSQQNIKMVYLYDEQGNMIETNRFNSYNMILPRNSDKYLDTLLQMKIDTSFSIELIYPGFWQRGTPSVNKWKYNQEGQKIEYEAYGYSPNGRTAVVSFIAEWNYDEQGKLKQEIHRDVWKDRVRKIIEFDGYGNPIKELEIGYGTLKDRVSTVQIEYY